MNDKGIEVVTVYRGKDSATYLLSEFQELGDKATPIAVRQYPGDRKPYRKIELKDTDAIAIEKVDQSLPIDGATCSKCGKVARWQIYKEGSHGL